MWRHLKRCSALVAVLVLVLAGCSNSTPEDNASSNPTASNNNASLDKNDYPVFPDADAGADPSVSAELGGRGFTGEGWETNTSYDLIGDPRAVKGGVFRGYGELSGNIPNGWA
jgi:hypothetical protein